MRGTFRTVVAFCLGTSALIAAPAFAQVIDYPNGTDNTSPIVLTNNTTQLQVLTGSATQSGVISESGGSFGLDKIGAGTLIYSAANTYSGVTTISNGALQIGNGGTSGNIAGNIVNNSLLVFNRANTLNLIDETYAGTISGNGAVRMDTGLTILTGTNTYTGGTTIAGGALRLSNGGSVVGSIVDNGVLQFSQPDGYTFGNAISGSGSVSSIGAGTLTIVSDNNYTGGTHVSPGSTLQIGNGGTTGSIVGDIDIGNTGNIIFNRSDGFIFAGAISLNGSIVTRGGGTMILSGPVFSGNATIESGVLQFGTGGTATSSSSGTSPYMASVNNSGTLIIDYSNTFEIRGVISGSGSLRQIGTGTLLLSGANTYTGGTTITAGTLRLGANMSLASVNVNGGTFDVNGQTVSVGALSGSLLNGMITLGSGSLTITGAGGAINVPISGSGSLTKAGGGTVIMGVANSYTGGTTINGGLLILSSGANLASSGALTVNGGILQIQGSLQTVGALSGTGGIIRLDGVGLTTNSTANTTLASEIDGFGSFAKGGSGTLTLTGTNTYAGVTNITGGVLRLGTGGTLGHGSLVVDGGTFDLNGHTQTVSSLSGAGGAITLGTGSLIVNGSGGTLASVISGNGSFTFQAIDTLTLTGANTYTGGTTINLGTLKLGFSPSNANPIEHLAPTGALTVNGGRFDLNGEGVQVGALSGTGGAITLQGGSLTTVSSANTTLATVISGQGLFIKGGTGTLVLTGNNTYFGGSSGTGTLLQAGTLQIGNGGTVGAIESDVDNRATLVFNRSDTLTYAGRIQGTGSVIQSGSGTLILTGTNSPGSTTIANGTLIVGNGGTSGLINRGSIMDNGALIFNRSDDVTFSDVISGAGTLTKAGAGTLIFTGANAYTGGTTISGGALQLGAAGNSGGSILGNVVNNGALIFNRSDAVAFPGMISGTGAVSKLGAGTLTVSGASTFTGATTVSAGTLNVLGSITSTRVTVAAGATLTGTGQVGATTVSSGATLNPGNGTAPGILWVAGNLTLASGANYLDVVTPTAAGLTSVNGAANLNGAVTANVASGTYTFGQRFTLITATGGVSGTFASLTGIPATLKGQLSYDANNAYLTLSPNMLAPLTSNTSGNQSKVLSAIDAAVTAGSVPASGFVTLYTLSGPALNAAIDQISGQAAPNVTNAVGQGFLSFMSMTANGGSDDAASFAPGSAYGGADAPHRAQLGAGQTRVWGAAYGGHVGLSGNSASGAASLSSNNVGMIGGADVQIADGFIAGATLGLGRQLFHSGNGSGDSNDILFGLYGRADAGAGYVTASFGLGWHQIKTLRVVTVSGTDVLQGKQNADDYGGRIEAGWRLAMNDNTSVIPYGAFAGESFESPASAETAVSGASTFALSYAAETTAMGRSELGARLDRQYGLELGSLTADLHAAWAHQLDDLPFTQASFQNLSGAVFQVAGVRPGRDTALLGLDLEVRNNSGLFFGVRGEGQFGAGTTIVEGLGNLGWRW